MKKISQAEYEELSHEWHPTKNTKSFYNVVPGSGEVVWWLNQECGHEWPTKMFARAVRGAGCPFCGNRELLTGFNDIATVHPDWVAFWSPSNEKSPHEVLSGGRAEYAWLCEKNHEYFSSVGHKERGRSCPYCLNMKLLVDFNDLATVHPDLAEELDVQKNGGLTAKDVIAGGRAKYWWRGKECGHSWETTIRRRVDGAGCHICAGLEVLAGFNDLASQSPAVAAELHPNKNGNLTADKIYVNSTLSLWWKCTNDHEFEAKVWYRTRQSRNCLECKKLRREVKEDNLTITHPDIATEWHPTLNGTALPTHYTAGSNKKVWWLTPCGHAWDANIYLRTGPQRQTCPICSGKRVLVDFNDLAFKAPEIARDLHPTLNGDLTATDFTVGSNKQLWWQCPINVNHVWKNSPYKRVLGGRNCPACSGHKVIPGINDLATVHPKLAKQLHPTKNGDITAEMIVANGGRVRMWWQCDKNNTHEWEASVAGRVRGRGCPQCWAHSYISKAEQELHDYVQSLDESMTVIQSDKKLLKGKELDIYIPDKKIAIEFNGLFWHTEQSGKGRNYHYEKWAQCGAAGVQLIQIWEDEWNRNPEQIKQMIAHKLGFSSQKKVFARKTIVGEVSKNDAELFLNQHHVQGYASGSYYVGLTEKGSDKLAALLVLRREPNNVLNIIRYATSMNVVGGFTKLLKYAERSYQPDSFITFADHCVSDGGLYENNGFIADKMLPADYMYVVGNERKHKFGYRLKKFKNSPDLLWEEGLTEKELAELNGLEKVWDAGKTRYRYVPVVSSSEE